MRRTQGYFEGWTPGTTRDVIAVEILDFSAGNTLGAFIVIFRRIFSKASTYHKS